MARLDVCQRACVLLRHAAQLGSVLGIGGGNAGICVGAGGEGSCVSNDMGWQQQPVGFVPARLAAEGGLGSGLTQVLDGLPLAFNLSG